MAAFEPWLEHMSTPKPSRSGAGDGDTLGPATPGIDLPSTPSGGAPPIHAAFSPATLADTTSKTSSTRRSTILVHQKSPLLLATPPQVTRALAYSHSFILPLNKLVGLLSWTSGDPWESFLLVAVFWAVVLYGDIITRTAGPVMVVLGLILGMYSRRFSPLSSSGWTDRTSQSRESSSAGANGLPAGKLQKPNTKASANGPAFGHRRANSEVTNTRHQKTLDEIVETLKQFTGRCNVLLEPMLELTDFLSTQRTPTSATTRPALMTLFVRIVLCTPFWVALTLPPWRIITTRRVVLVLGTVILTWHAKVMRVGRAIIWRSATVRRTAAIVTGLRFEGPVKPGVVPGTGTVAEAEGTARKILKRHESELSKALRQQSHRHGHQRRTSKLAKDAGVKFTFIIYENQRRWIGLGWTTSLFAYERGAWTDEHNHLVPPRDSFELPEVEDGSHMRWRWVEGSRWKVDGVPAPEDGSDEVDYDGEAGKMGWIYYDNKWQNGRRGQDSWGRWTRRRKWYRDAELVEVEDEPALAQSEAAPPEPQLPLTPPSPAGNTLTSKRYSTVEEKMTATPVTPASKDADSTKAAGPSADKSSDKDTDSIKSASGGAGADSASLMSTSSRSFFTRPGPVRRRVTASTPLDKARRASEAKSEEEAAGLGVQVELGIQGSGKQGDWGIGDEARTWLE